MGSLEAVTTAAIIGCAIAVLTLLAAQFGLAALIDRYGWFGIEPVPVSWARVLGIALLAIGAALTLQR